MQIAMQENGSCRIKHDKMPGSDPIIPPAPKQSLDEGGHTIWLYDLC